MLLPSLLGNPRLKAAAKNMPRAPGVPVLLCGPQGAGKSTAARDIAMGLFCTGAAHPCGVCPACVRMAAGSHPDYYALAYEGKPVKVEQVRELRNRTFIKPQEAEFKVFVIHRADKLSPQCQNALLKVLEEPQSCHFILTAQNREALLQTVRSRCVSYHMEPLSQADILAALKGREGDVQAAAAQCGGFLGAAIAGLEGVSPAWEAAAADFADSLTKGELEIFRACTQAAKLGRDDFALFHQAAKAHLLEALKAGGDSRFITVSEYLDTQAEYMPHNPSVTALSGALAAYCGVVMR